MEILILVFVVAAFIFYLTAEPNQTQGRRDFSVESQYPAVKIKPCEHACQAAAQTAQIIFLAANAPKLPLNACDRIGDCDCQFRHYADRRQQEDRRDGSFVMRDLYAQGERRGAKRIGRRASDRFSVALTAND